jgi:hypothetical protein
MYISCVFLVLIFFPLLLSVASQKFLFLHFTYISNFQCVSNSEVEENCKISTNLYQKKYSSNDLYSLSNTNKTNKQNRPRKRKKNLQSVEKILNGEEIFKYEAWFLSFMTESNSIDMILHLHLSFHQHFHHRYYHHYHHQHRYHHHRCRCRQVQDPN